MIHPPTHLFYFSRATITSLLQRCGFEVQFIVSIGMHRSIRQTLHVLFVQRHPWLRPLYDRLSDFPLGKLNYYLNLGDIMFVAAKSSERS